MSSEESEVARFFRDRSIFVTGATGFMGKVLVEKLLYSCPDLRAIYILSRSKRNKSMEQRIEEMFQLPLFSRLRQKNPDAIHKVLPIDGDVTLKELGLTPENKSKLQEEVSVVFHCAATVRLEAKLKDAVEMNTTGTLKVLQLARGMTQLKVFMHLSTAFCHCDIEELDEKAYDCPVDPHDIMRLVEWMDEASLDLVRGRLISPHPNTYTFTKRLAESLVRREFPDLPVVIVRPSIVLPAWKEPLPGWVDNLNGPIGLLVAGGKGVLRSMHCVGEYAAHIVPVDLAINGMLAVAWHVGTSANRSNDVPVFNLSFPDEKILPWRDIMEKGLRMIRDNPFEMTIWYPGGNIRSSLWVHNLCVIFLHFLPAYFLDFLLLIFGQKRFMVRIQHKIKNGLDILQYFTTRDWHFHSDNIWDLRAQMNPTDNNIFYLNTSDVDPDEFILNTVLGSRQYCLKEPLSSLSRCRRNLKILYVVDRVWTAALYIFLVWLIFCYSETARHLLDFSTHFLKNVPVVGNFVPVNDM